MSESHNQRTDVPELTADQIQARVLHRDGLMLVIDKPAGLPVHRGPKGGANLETSFDALRFGLPRPPVLAHRLDRDTSGCLVLGRHRRMQDLGHRYRRHAGCHVPICHHPASGPMVQHSDLGRFACRRDLFLDTTGHCLHDHGISGAIRQASLRWC